MNANKKLLHAIACIKTIDSQQNTEHTNRNLLPDDQLPVITDFNNGLAAVYLVDEGEHFSYVQNHQLAAVNAQAKGLHEIGVLNLSRLAQEKLRVTQYGPIYGVFLDGQFEASLILLDDLWDETLAPYTPNGAIVTLPTRDVLAFCDAKSLEGIAELKQMARRMLANGKHVLTGTLYFRQNGEWLALD